MSTMTSGPCISCSLGIDKVQHHTPITTAHILEMVLDLFKTQDGLPRPYPD